MDFTTQQKVIGLYALMPEEINLREINRVKLHDWFYQRKKQDPSMFENLKFNWDGSYPLSKEIDYINSTLKTVAGLSRNLCDFCKNYFNEKMKPKINEKELDEMKRLSKSLFDFLSSN